MLKKVLFGLVVALLMLAPMVWADTDTPTETFTQTDTRTATNTRTQTYTKTYTYTFTITFTRTNTYTPTYTPTPKPIDYLNQLGDMAFGYVKVTTTSGVGRYTVPVAFTKRAREVIAFFTEQGPNDAVKTWGSLANGTNQMMIYVVDSSGSGTNCSSTSVRIGYILLLHNPNQIYSMKPGEAIEQTGMMALLSSGRKVYYLGEQ